MPVILYRGEIRVLSEQRTDATDLSTSRFLTYVNIYLHIYNIYILSKYLYSYLGKSLFISSIV